MVVLWCAGGGGQRASIKRAISILVVDEERMRPGHWLLSVLWVYFSALTLLVGWQEGHPTY